MRIFGEILLFALGIAMLLTIGRGFPMFGAMLRHPIVWLLLAALFLLIMLRRGRAPRQR